jgi:endonuclease/exonuclease/phosphatase family metal-dependent hydrolase
MKVVSLNVEPLAEGEDRLERLAALATELEALDADVVALHGVKGDGVHLNLGREIRSRLPAYEHLLIERAERDGPRWRGLAILSKTEVRRHGHMELTPGSASGHALLWAELEIDGKPLYVFNTQFDADPDAAQREVERLVPFIQVCKAPGLLVATLNGDTCKEAERYLTKSGWKSALSAKRAGTCGCDGDEHLYANAHFKAPVRAKHVLANSAPVAGPGVMTTV